MPTQTLQNRFNRIIQEEHLIEPGEGVLTGVSGGPDSVAMLELLCGFNESENGNLRLHVAHLNHQLRGADAEEDADFVRRLAEAHGLPFTMEAIDVRQYADQAGMSIEQAGRECRFAMFNRVCVRERLKVIALGHHADDNAETVLHRVIRGTGIRGLSGIPRSRPIREGCEIRFVRPLLSFRRAEIMAYLDQRAVSYRTDASNEVGDHTRNRIRHQVLPLLSEQFNPQVVDALNRLAEQAAGLEDYLTETAERMLAAVTIEHSNRGLVLHCPPLARRARVIRSQVVRQALLRMGMAERDLSFGHLSTIADLVLDQQGSKSVDLPAGFRVTRQYTRLIFEGPAAAGTSGPREMEWHVSGQGLTILPDHAMELTIEVVPADPRTIRDHIHHAGPRAHTVMEEWIDADQVHAPLVARTRRPGDRFYPLGMTGMKKLSDFFIDEKIEPAQRDRAVILCDRLGPIWIVPFRIDERVRLSEATRHVMQLKARHLD